MSYSTRDTQWAISAKGNYWRRLDGHVLVVGERPSDGRYWALRDKEFMKGSFASLDAAREAAELGLSGEPDKFPSDEQVW